MFTKILATLAFAAIASGKLHRINFEKAQNGTITARDLVIGDDVEVKLAELSDAAQWWAADSQGQIHALEFVSESYEAPAEEGAEAYRTFVLKAAQKGASSIHYALLDAEGRKQMYNGTGEFNWDDAAVLGKLSFVSEVN